ncbi:MAG: hypothetical protein CL840_08735 [Crocinitomicaceae bacterium]|nr:hypothetical protein [Crocinitomicaceae bacterium]|tara:strand:- start:46178 stop:46621 length:444 start_codon:yes stop_codon:yes gene_type:complete
MKDLYDLLENFESGERDKESTKKLEEQLGNMKNFEHLNNKIIDSISHQTEKPSNAVKNKLDSLFEEKVTAKKPKHNGIIPLDELRHKKPWKVFAYAASFSMFLYFTVQIGFSDMSSVNVSLPLMADSLEKSSVDSNQFYIDSLVIPN